MPQPDLQPDEAGAKPVTVDESPKSRPAFQSLKRDLTQDDLASPGVQKMLLDSVLQADIEISALRSFREKFHESDKQNAILGEKLKSNRAAEALSTGTIAVGAAAWGYAPAFSASPTQQYVLVAFGLVLVVVGVIAKVARA